MKVFIKITMIRFLLVLTSALSIAISGYSQEKVTLNGYIRDVSNGEELIGVTVYIPEIKAGTVTNAYGFYSITVAPGNYQVLFSYVGYKTQSVAIDLTKSESRNIELVSEATMIQEIVVEDKALDANVVDVQMSRNEINVEQIKKLPSLFGEPDIIKNIQLLPGVISAGEGTSSFFVRGGSADQNLILIDEAPVYDPSHFFGLFSVFNADVIKDAELYKGGIPSRFGGRLSSILEVRTKDGNNRQFSGSGGLGLMASRIMLEGPIRKEKSSFIISARRSYVDLFLKAADSENSVYFYDVNAKVNWKHRNNNRFFAAIYAGRDYFSAGGGIFSFGWGNATGTFRWNHLFNDRLFSNTSLIISNFDYALRVRDAVLGIEWTSSLQELSFKNDMSYFINTNNELTFGYHLTGRQFSPGKIFPSADGSIFSGLELQKMYALDHGIYIGNRQRVNDNLTVDYGVRLSVFQNVGTADVFLYEDSRNNVEITRTDTLHYEAWENIKTYINVEPRLAVRYALGPDHSLKASYNRMVQNTHLIASGTVPLPFNTWNPSSYYLKPQIADQVAAGYFRNFQENTYEASVELYYKDIQNITDFADNAQIFFNEDLATEFRQGDSWSYGAELMVNKTQGKLTGMVSYTLSKTVRNVPGVNRDMDFLANYDRRHALNIAATIDMNAKWAFGANFTYNTGRPITLPVGKFEYDNYLPTVITERNSYRLPAFHRLDISATLSPLKYVNKRFKGQWVFSIYNVYNRKNPFTIYTRTAQDEDGNIIGDGTQKEARLIYLFPILPSVTYNFKF